jgi:hypothetical protein
MNSNHIIFEESESMEVSSKDPSIRDHDLPNVDRLALSNYQNYQLQLAAQETPSLPVKTKISPKTNKLGTSPITHGSISTIEIERDSDHPKVSESSIGRDTKSNIGLKTPRSPEQNSYRDLNDSEEIGRIQDEFDQLDILGKEDESIEDLGPFDTAQIEKDTETVPDYMMISDTYRKVGIDDVDYMKLDEEVEDFKRIMEKSDRCVKDIKMRIEKSPIVGAIGMGVLTGTVQGKDCIWGSRRVSLWTTVIWIWSKANTMSWPRTTSCERRIPKRNRARRT